MDILDIFLHILLKPPQPLIGLFFNVSGKTNKNSQSNDTKLFLFVRRSAYCLDILTSMSNKDKPSVNITKNQILNYANKQH